MKRYPEPSRPAGLPDAAVWNAKENEWELGQHSADGKEVGEWLWWYPDGTMVCHAIYNDEGQLHGHFRRFHPNGELSQWAEWTNGKVHGLNSWTRPTSGPSDKASVLPPNLSDDVMRMSVPYDRGRPQQFHFTLYTIDGMHNPVPHDDDGRSIDLGSHLWRVAAETTLFLLEPNFEDIEGNLVHNDSDEKVRWIFDGSRKSPDVFGVRLVKGSKTQTYEVSSREMSRAFTLSSDYYLASLKEKRPAGVPEGAIWNLVDLTWELGETEKKRKVGAWQVWDNLGRLRKRETYSKFGVLHGDFEHLHPDNTPAIRARYYKGEIEEAMYFRKKKSDVPFPDDVEETVQRIECIRIDSYLYRRFFLKNGKEVNRLGVLIDDVFADAVFDVDPDVFLKEHFSGYVADGEAAVVFEPPLAALSHSAFSWVFEAVAQHKKHHIQHWQFETGWGSTWSPGAFSSLLLREAPPETNRFEFVLENGRYGEQIDLREIFFGVFSLGRESRTKPFFMVDTTGETESVWLYDSQKDGMQGRIAADLAAFVYLQCALDAYENLGVISGEALGRAIARVEGRCFALGPFQGVMPESHQSLIRRQERHPLETRSKWIVDVLRGVDPSVAMRSFDASDGWPDISEMDHARCAINASEAVYWMWRLFFVSDSERLDALVAGLKEAPSALIQDAASLMDEILWGRENLGKIEDIYELRAEVCAAFGLPDAPEMDIEEDEEDTSDPGKPKPFSSYLKRLSSWSHDSEVFWNVAMHVERATPEERKKARAHFEGLHNLGPLNTPMARFALKRLGGDVDDVRMWVRTALAKEMNPRDIKSGEWQKIWALRIAGEDESVEVDVLIPWVSYPYPKIQQAAREALSRKVPEMVVDPLPDPDVSTAEQIADAVEMMLSTWIPFAQEMETPEYLIRALERLQERGDLTSFIRASKVCLEHDEPVIFEASLRFAPPFNASLVEAMTKIEETATGWPARVAREWLLSQGQV